MKENSLSYDEKLDIVIPIYNEEESIELFHASLVNVIASLPLSVRVLYVDDGSKDLTAEKVRAFMNAEVRVELIQLSRNFGHQAALTAGLDYASGDWVLSMDGDGQHPPEMIPEMLKLGKSGYDLVLTQRIESDQATGFKHRTSSLFYRLINRLAETPVVPGSADFRLMNRKTLNALRSMPEYHRFLRGMVAWLGFRSLILPFEPAERLRGASKYSLRKMVKLAMDATFSFSLTPLYASLVLGCGFLLLALVEVVYVLSFWLRGAQSSLEPGWSSLMFMLLMVGGTLLVMLGVTGIYVGYILQEVKKRPVYIIGEIYSHQKDSKSDRRLKE